MSDLTDFDQCTAARYCCMDSLYGPTFIRSPKNILVGIHLKSSTTLYWYGFEPLLKFTEDIQKVLNDFSLNIKRKILMQKLLKVN